MDEDTIAVRDSKVKTLSPLLFTQQEWEAFRDGVKRGEFDAI